ncbi:hypothetical protein [Agrobacterium cavarae]|uniref:hypothetical protein n=1 Tax=Agrobacterium cavarae TaxID=2528239 RepID=UPI0028A8D2B7|nr:hypothetical protein [Agrobacterium cavarae]
MLTTIFTALSAKATFACGATIMGTAKIAKANATLRIAFFPKFILVSPSRQAIGPVPRHCF